jgi:salicylate hydroxylase
MNDPDVIIVGGGIGGLAAAYALSRQGLQVRLLEQAPEFGEVGAGLQLAPNCTRILSEYGLLDEARRLGVVPDDMIMYDAVDGRELTRLDLRDLQVRFGFPYLVMHRSDLHQLLLTACRDQGVDLRTAHRVTAYHTTEGVGSASILMDEGDSMTAPLIIAADGLHSVAREHFVCDSAVSSAYVAYRGAVPMEVARQTGLGIHDDAVVVYVGPGCHMVQYGLRGGQMLNQVAVFESPKAKAGELNWGTPDELDQAFVGTCDHVRDGLPLLQRDRWWRMFDRDPADTWVFGRVALLGDAAHPPLQYMAQGAVMAIEDGWVLAQHVARHRDVSGTVDWEAVLSAYQAVRVEHCRRVVLTARAWGELWHLTGKRREQRNVILGERSTYDYSYIDWIYGPTALFPEDEPEMYPVTSPAGPRAGAAHLR